MSTLVVIEGSRTVQRMIEIALEGLGHELHFTRDPSALPPVTPNLIISASSGPWGDAPALFAHLNAHIKTPVILLTPQQSEPKRFVGGQVVAALKKPFHTQSLARAVCQALNLPLPFEGLFDAEPSIPLKRGGVASAAPVADSVIFKTPVPLYDEAPPPVGTFEGEPPAVEPPNPPSAWDPPVMSEGAPEPMETMFQTSIGAPVLEPPPIDAPPPLFTEPPPSFEPPPVEAGDFDASTSFGFSPGHLDELEVEPPPPFTAEELPWGGEQRMEQGMERATVEEDGDESAPPAPPPLIEEDLSTQELEELEELDLDDSFSALDHAELEGMIEEESSSELTPEPTPELNLDHLAQSSSPLLNSAVTQVVRLVAESLKAEGIEQATHDEALTLFAQVAWELIPELAERVVREEVERALSEGDPHPEGASQAEGERLS